MRHYHQPYSEVVNMPLEFMLFLVSLLSEEAKYHAHLNEKKQKNWKNKLRFWRR